MVSLRDFKTLRSESADFAELLLSDSDDLEVADDILEAKVRFVHTPEFIRHKHTRRLLDLSSNEEDFRHASIEAVLRTREVADALGGLPVIVHPGGIRRESHSKEGLLENLERSLEVLGRSGILLENMPWFYWFKKKDRMFSNICVSIDDIRRVLRHVDGLTLDVCHGYLSEPRGNQGYCREFMKVFGQNVKHLHVSDARAPDSEGLQILEGDIDFSFLKGVEVPITVEIWNGHLNDGQGFWLGIERLRALERSWQPL